MDADEQQMKYDAALMRRNPWTPTEADALPWGETVEVRWPDGSTIRLLEPYTEYGSFFWWQERDYYEKDVKLGITNTEWRRCDDRG